MKRKVLLIKLKRARAGRPRGAPDSVPRQVRASVKAVIEEVVSERKLSIRHAIEDGLSAGPRHADRYLRLCAEYTDGKPDATLNLRTHFKEDEMAVASRELERKMAHLLRVAQGSVAVLMPENSTKDGAA